MAFGGLTYAAARIELLAALTQLADGASGRRLLLGLAGATRPANVDDDQPVRAGRPSRVKCW
ncbi:hypothetical protein [Brevundimonas lutea]|uniref:hypothetical protein n=1 Tax=Brevundimonas lutea TaxID=2293980 RepID=UPI000F017E98|nr:hypothetical protein [Brevundimonas lutea]